MATLIKHARYDWLLLAESHLTRTAVWRDAREDGGAGVAGGIGDASSSADFGNDKEEGGSVCASYWTNDVFRALHVGESLDSPSGAQGSSLDPSGPRSLPQRPRCAMVWSKCGQENGNRGLCVIISFTVLASLLSSQQHSLFCSAL